MLIPGLIAVWCVISWFSKTPRGLALPQVRDPPTRRPCAVPRTHSSRHQPTPDSGVRRPGVSAVLQSSTKSSPCRHLHTRQTGTGWSGSKTLNCIADGAPSALPRSGHRLCARRKWIRLQRIHVSINGRICPETVHKRTFAAAEHKALVGSSKCTPDHILATCVTCVVLHYFAAEKIE